MLAVWISSCLILALSDQSCTIDLIIEGAPLFYQLGMPDGIRLAPSLHTLAAELSDMGLAYALPNYHKNTKGPTILRKNLLYALSIIFHKSF